MTFEEILSKFSKFVKEKGYTPKEPVGLLSPAFPHEFNVSAGHDYAREIFETNEPIISPIKYSLVDTSFRRIDMEHVGFSDRHLSLFHIALFACGVTSEKMCIQINKLISDFIQLLSEVLDIPPNKLLITVFDGGPVLNFNLEREIALIESLQHTAIPESKILPLKGRRAFFLAQNVECSGPTCEIYFDRGDKSMVSSRFVEIGSINFYKYRYNSRNSRLEISPNQIFVCAIGVERTLMILQNKPSIFDIDIIAPLIDVVSKYFSNRIENFIFINSVRTIIDGIRSSIFILAEGISPDNSPRGRILKKIFKSVVNQMKYLNLSNLKILDELQGKVIELYGPFYPRIRQQKINLRSLISDRFGAKKEEIP